MDEPTAETYLTQLREELAGRDWTARLGGRDNAAKLTVTNPGTSQLSEQVTCCRLIAGWTFCWPWGQPIGPVSEVAAVADRVQHVLREAVGQ